MLHIKDIKERLKQFPEPVEVKEIRDKILGTFNKLEFIEDCHKYFLPHTEDEGKDELISVSKLIEQFIPEVDWDEISARKAEKEGITVEELRRRWKENNIRATNSGSLHHLFGEMYQHFFMGNPKEINEIIKPQYERGFLVPSCPKQSAICEFYSDLHNVPTLFPVLAETKVYMGVNDMFPIKQKYAGTFDMLFTFKDKNGDWKLTIMDFKTNASLTNDYVRKFDKMMLPPFDDLYDDAMGHYTVQLSAYELCLRQIGFEIADRKLIWLKDDGTYEKISLPSISDRLAEIL